MYAYAGDLAMVATLGGAAIVVVSCVARGRTGLREPNRSRSPAVSHGMRLSVSADGRVRFRETSRIVDFP